VNTFVSIDSSLGRDTKFSFDCPVAAASNFDFVVISPTGIKFTDGIHFSPRDLFIIIPDEAEVR